MDNIFRYIDIHDFGYKFIHIADVDLIFTIYDKSLDKYFISRCIRNIKSDKFLTILSSKRYIARLTASGIDSGSTKRSNR